MLALINLSDTILGRTIWESKGRLPQILLGRLSCLRTGTIDMSAPAMPNAVLRCHVEMLPLVGTSGETRGLGCVRENSAEGEV
jgi:hypothetical protein